MLAFLPGGTISPPGCHPLALLRLQLCRRWYLSIAELLTADHGRPARAAGVVIGRQRPGSASGVTFVTLEDETGTVNVVVWRVNRRGVLTPSGG